jgi:hypothetical protein
VPDTRYQLGSRNKSHSYMFGIILLSASTRLPRSFDISMVQSEEPALGLNTVCEILVKAYAPWQNHEDLRS